jgi:hypothetical protein
VDDIAEVALPAQQRAVAMLTGIKRLVQNGCRLQLLCSSGFASVLVLGMLSIASTSTSKPGRPRVRYVARLLPQLTLLDCKPRVGFTARRVIAAFVALYALCVPLAGANDYHLATFKEDVS